MEKSAYSEIFNNESVAASMVNDAIADGMIEETEALQPVNAVTSDGREKETELSAPPFIMDKSRLVAVESALERLDEMESGIALNAKYREFDAIGKVIRGVFLGMKTIYKKDGGEMKPIECASWIDKDKQVWIAGGKILVSQCQDLPVGTPIEITYTQKIKVEMGYAKEFEVRPLY